MLCRVNGHEHSVEAVDGEDALTVIRDRLGLTGAKRVCESGVCGACAVLVDGAPSASCLMPADALDGKSVRTVEGLAGPNPVQRALTATDAIQCGYCTPGFAVAGTAFFDEWRREHGTTRPSADEVRAALSGNLCRCGCYLRIVDAIQEACEGLHDGPFTPQRHDAVDKVTGAAKYTTDVVYSDQLEGVIVSSPVASAMLIEIDDSAARSAPGVHAVVRLLPEDGRIRYVGHEIVAVAAESLAQAREAAATIKLRFDQLPASPTMAIARSADAPTVYDNDHKTAPSAGEVPELFRKAQWHGNIRGFKPPRFGAAARSARAAARILQGDNAVDGVWTTESQSHIPLEPHACVARWNDEGLVVHLSTQAIGVAVHMIARRWKLRASAVRVLAVHVGGAFGGKQTLTSESIAAIELAKVTGRPVRVAFDHRQELTAGGHRPASETHLKLDVTPDGRLKALGIEAYADTGVAVGSEVAQVAGLMYPGPPRELRDYTVVTNAPPGKPFRAPSGPPAFWALEQAVDECAHRLEIDPLDLRRRWDPEPTRQRLYDWVESETPWRDRSSRRGIGLAVATWYYYVQPGARVCAKVDQDGLEVAVGTQEVGAGCRSLLSALFAEEFGIPEADIRVRVGDSQLPPGPMAAGSSTTTSLVPAAHDAADKLRKAVLQRLGATVDGTGIRYSGGVTSWAEAFRQAAGVEVVGRRPKDDDGRPSPWYSPNFGRGRGSPSVAQVTEVEVDERFGRVRVLRTWCALAVGRAIRPVLATTQVHGAIIQSIGQTLYEHRRIDLASGVTLSSSLDSYSIPGIADVPAITVDFIEGGFDHVPQRAVGLAEVAALATPASIGNAVFHATGRRPRALPLRPDVLLGDG